jgi:hypothetical protein
VQILKKYVADHPEQFQLIESHVGGEKGPNFVAEDLQHKAIIYIEVELDAKDSKKARAFAKRAIELHKTYNKPVLLWMVASSDKWITTKDRTGVKDHLEKIGKEENVRIMKRISPLTLGAYASQFVTQIAPLSI